MQRVYLNKRGMHSIEIEEPIIKIPLKSGEETMLDIEVINYESPAHIYLSAAGDVKDKVKFNRNNPYIDGEELLTLKISNPRNHNELHEGKIIISTGYGSKEESFTLKIGKIDDEDSPDAIEIDENLGLLNYRTRRTPGRVRSGPSFRVKMPSFHLGSSLSRLRIDFERIRYMTNIPFILIVIGVILTLIAFAFGRISYGAVILGLIIVVIIAYYISKLID